jgi:hypothetical protein
MFVNSALTRRIAIGKGVGFSFGLVGFVAVPYFWPDAGWMLRWGILLWYGTLGGIIGMIAVQLWHPVLRLTLPWWFSASFLGAWMNFVLTLFAYDTMAAFLNFTFGADGLLSSPFWFVLEGAAIGLVIGYVVNRFGGVEKETLN